MIQDGEIADLSTWVKWGISKHGGGGGVILSEYIIFGENNHKWDNGGFFLYVKSVRVHPIKYFLKVALTLLSKWKDAAHLWIYTRHSVKKVIIMLGHYCAVCS